MFPKLDRLWQIPAVYCLLLTALALATPLTFAPYYNFWLMPLLFGGLVRLIELKPHRAVRSAYWFGLIGYTAQFWWIHTALHGIAKLPEYFAIPLTLLLPAFLGLYPALAFWLYRRFRLPRNVGLGIGLPMLWTLTEFARERLLTGFGWGALGYSQIAENSPLAGFAPLGGIHLVTFATALVGTWLVLLVNSRAAKPRITAAIGIVAILLSGCLLRTIAFTQPTGSPTTVALVQGNIEQRLKFAPNQLLPTYQRYLSQVAATRAQIVILPETALPVFLQNTRAFVSFGDVGGTCDIVRVVQALSHLFQRGRNIDLAQCQAIESEVAKLCYIVGKDNAINIQVVSMGAQFCICKATIGYLMVLYLRILQVDDAQDAVSCTTHHRLEVGFIDGPVHYQRVCLVPLVAQDLL